MTRFARIGLALATGLIAVLVVGASALSPSQAQEQASCPAGSVLSADGTACVSETNDGVNDNVTTTTSCTQGVLSDDGQFCIVPRLDADTTGSTSAPAADGTVQAPIPTFTG